MNRTAADEPTREPDRRDDCRPAQRKAAHRLCGGSTARHVPKHRRDAIPRLRRNGVERRKRINAAREARR